MQYKVLQVTMADRLRVEVMSPLNEVAIQAAVITTANNLEGHAPYLQKRALKFLEQHGVGAVAEAAKRELLRRQLRPHGNTIEVRFHRFSRPSSRTRG